ncbi:hypothetical protein SCA6_017752 [Theobroma cacao]
MSDDCEYAYTQCHPTSWRCSPELLAIPLVSDFLLYHMDGCFRHFSMDHSCLCLNLVLSSGIHAPTMLWHVCIDCKYQALPVVKMVPSVLPVFKIKNVGFVFCQKVG